MVWKIFRSLGSDRRSGVKFVPVAFFQSRRLDGKFIISWIFISVCMIIIIEKTGKLYAEKKNVLRQRKVC